jgi:hypothetical protein
MIQPTGQLKPKLFQMYLDGLAGMPGKQALTKTQTESLYSRLRFIAELDDLEARAPASGTCSCFRGRVYGEFVKGRRQS